MAEAPPLTLLLGPMSQGSLALNGLIRSHRRVLEKLGLTAFANRAASPLLRKHLGGGSPDARALAFHEDTAKRPAFLAALNFFGAPHEALKGGEMFPDAEQSLLGLSAIAPTARFVICIDVLPAMFLAARSKPLEARVRRTTWEVLYELSWADLAGEIRAAVPNGELLVLTPEGTGRRGAGILRHLFGDAAEGLPDAYALLRSSISTTGQAVLDRILSDGEPSTETLDELQRSFALRPSQAEIQESLGLDKVTVALLEQRFDEDLIAIQALPGTEVI